MKIISPFRDYYDHEVARFGYDSTRVYDRRNTKEQTYSLNCLLAPDNNVLTFAICGVLHIVTHVKFSDTKSVFVHQNNIPNNLKDKVKEAQRYFVKASAFQGQSTDLNLQYRQPVLLIDHGNKGWYSKGIPLLKNFAFPGVIPSEQMYSDIYNYLGFLVDNPPIPNKQTDKEKVVAHGFDVGESFRPKIKKK